MATQFPHLPVLDHAGTTRNFEKLQAVLTDTDTTTTGLAASVASLEARFAKPVGNPVVFEHSWANFETGFLTVTYLKDALGFVHLAGLMKSGEIGKSAFTLPVGFRPSAKLLYPAWSHEVFGALQVESDGKALPISPSSNISFSLAGVTFLAEA